VEVIKSGDTNGPITATALGSVERFLTYKILNINSSNLPQAMLMLSSAATHCKFEGSDSVSDEFVLLKILQVLRLSLTCEVGKVLSDEALCVMMETGLSMCCQMRLSGMFILLKKNIYIYFNNKVITLNLKYFLKIYHFLK
jgi:brefeldin A-resistance guanine nucleotide exchange factor 1